MGKVSVIIPSRRERFLQQTIDDIFRNARGDIEVIAVHDGTEPEVRLNHHPRLTQIFWNENKGMRAGINEAARIATGDYLLKSDGHCAFAEGFDEVLKADCDQDWIVIPRRYSLDAENWCRKPDKPPVDYHYLSYCFDKPADDVTVSMHGSVWRERAKERANILIDDEMSSQGSCWFTPRKYFLKRIGPLDDVNYGTFYQEAQEFGMKCWLSGGRMVINKKTWYAHLHKGKTYGTGYGFTNAQWATWKEGALKAKKFTLEFWAGNQWAERVHDFEWLINKFNPPGWPANWQAEVERFLGARQ